MLKLLQQSGLVRGQSAPALPPTPRGHGLGGVVAPGAGADAGVPAHPQLEEEAAEESLTAALKIQARVRGQQVRARKAGDTAAASALAAEAEAAEEAVAAAVRVQAGVRGRQARARQQQHGGGGGGVTEAEAEEDVEAEAAAANDAVAAAVRVQASVRGRQVRVRQSGDAAESAALAAEAQEADEAVAAAVRVQASVRGRQVRAARASARDKVPKVVAKAVKRIIAAAIRSCSADGA